MRSSGARRAHGRRRRKDLPHCTMCGQRVLPQEPTFELAHRTAPGRLLFHEHERCGLPAFKALVAGEPLEWTLTHHRRGGALN
jgi:hypothetical protein